MVKFKFRQNKPVFQNKAVLDCISDLQEKFSVVSIEKAPKNFAIISKKLCVYKIIPEVGISSDHFSIYYLLNNFVNKFVSFVNV